MPTDPGPADTRVKFAWVSGAPTFTVGQQWGPTSYGAEPAGHGEKRWHAGLDLSVPQGSPLIYPDGMPPTTVAKAESEAQSGGYGNSVVVRVGDKDVRLGHMQSLAVTTGQQIKGGDSLGPSNNTGNSSGPHVHFEVRPANGGSGTDINPMPWLVPDGSMATAGSSSTSAPPGMDVGAAITGLDKAVTSAFNKMLGAGQVAAGLAVVIGGAVFLMMNSQAGQNVLRQMPVVGGAVPARRRPGQVPKGLKPPSARKAVKPKGETVEESAEAVAVSGEEPRSEPAPRGTRSKRRLISPAQNRRLAQAIRENAARPAPPEKAEASPLARYKRMAAARERRDSQ